MQKFIIQLSLLLVLVFVHSSVHGASSEVNWIKPDNYTDIRAGNTNRKQFKQQVFKAFEQHFAKLASKLPEGQQLKIDIHNIDLAGDVNAGGIDRLRIVKEIYFPKMKFSYRVLAADDSEITAGEADLKDMNFMSGAHLKYKHDTFGYEIKMLDHWFKETFE